MALTNLRGIIWGSKWILSQAHGMSAHAHTLTYRNKGCVCLQRGQVNKWLLLLKDKGLTHTHTVSFTVSSCSFALRHNYWVICTCQTNAPPPPLPGIGCLPTYIGELRCLINPYITRACVVLGTTITICARRGLRRSDTSNSFRLNLS